MIYWLLARQWTTSKLFFFHGLHPLSSLSHMPCLFVVIHSSSKLTFSFCSGGTCRLWKWAFLHFCCQPRLAVSQDLRLPGHWPSCWVQICLLCRLLSFPFKFVAAGPPLKHWAEGVGLFAIRLFPGENSLLPMVCGLLLHVSLPKTGADLPL